MGVGTVWADINYWNPHPPVVAQRRKQGFPVLDGLGMLVHQGAEAFYLFTGHRGDVRVMREAAEAMRS